jgi:hypothetical protein
MDEEKLIILVQGHECLYNLQHKDYDNNLVKDPHPHPPHNDPYLQSAADEMM